MQTLVAVLDAFGLQHVPVLAHSMGAHWSLWLAIDRPERVSRLVLIGNPGNVMLDAPPAPVRLLTKAPWNRWILTLLRPRHPRASKRLFKMMGADAANIAALPPQLLECYYRFWRLPHYLTSATSLMENGPPRLGPDELSRVAAPALMLWGTGDSFASVDKGREIAAALPRGALVALPGACHLPWLDAAPACARQTLGFL